MKTCMTILKNMYLSHQYQDILLVLVYLHIHHCPLKKMKAKKAKKAKKTTKTNLKNANLENVKGKIKNRKLLRAEVVNVYLDACIEPDAEIADAVVSAHVVQTVFAGLDVYLIVPVAIKNRAIDIA